MPPLSNVNISHNPSPVQTPAAQYQPPSNSPYVHDQAPPMPPQNVPIPQQANMQSWAGDTVQQPRPMQPAANAMGGMWNPELGIRFGNAAPPKPNQAQGGGGTWNPGSGIKFG